MANKLEEIFGAAASVAKGMSVTLKEMLSPDITETYPDEPPKFEERYRGKHVLQRDENGLEKCVACFLCSAACPAQCIYIEAAENTDQVRFITSITTGASFAAFAWKPARPMRSPMVTGSNCRASTPAHSFTAKRTCSPPCPRALIPRL